MGTVTIIQCKGTTWFPFKALEHSERVQSEVGEFDLKEEAQRYIDDVLLLVRN
jgi:hypothetical protein